MNRFHIWTIGCQMNKADSDAIGTELQRLGYQHVANPDEAKIIVVNSCAVRQSAEDKVNNKLTNLKALKRRDPEIILALTGCMVNSHTGQLKERFPHVDVFFGPQRFEELLNHMETSLELSGPPVIETIMQSPTAYVPIIHGCNNFCSYCIVPYRRGQEKSRSMSEIIHQIEGLLKRGVKEVTLLGQNVDSYGHDLPGQPDLADLLMEVNQVNELVRIRFLTSHPKDMSQKLIEAIASLEKVCEHISLPAQAGDNKILEAMRRGYTIEQYVNLIHRIRSVIPNAALSNDIIVGFPGETEAQFDKTYRLLEELRFDTVHIAAYSPRPDTLASSTLSDTVPIEEKRRRVKLAETLQEQISAEKNTACVGEVVEVLVEIKKKNKWQGRTRGDKLVFFEADGDYSGRLVQVKVSKAGAWSLQGTPVAESRLSSDLK